MFFAPVFLGIKKARMSIHKTAKSVLLGSPSDTVLKADFVRSWQYREFIISEHKNQHAVCFIFLFNLLYQYSKNFSVKNLVLIFIFFRIFLYFLKKVI